MHQRHNSTAVIAFFGILMPMAFVHAQESEPAPVEDIEPGVSGTELDAAGADAAPPGPGPEEGVVRRASNDGVIDQLDLGSTTITGNQELPKVLYILPWKQADLGDLVGRPVNTLLDEALEPVDRDVFRRQSRYYESLYSVETVEEP
ncbi:MAG: hypothetical protein AAGC71_12295 [Pseudomonadota bacterium]